MEGTVGEEGKLRWLDPVTDLRRVPTGPFVELIGLTHCAAFLTQHNDRQAAMQNYYLCSNPIYEFWPVHTTIKPKLPYPLATLVLAKRNGRHILATLGNGLQQEGLHQ